MLIPKQNNLAYGAVHIDYFIDFIGICIHPNNDDIQNVDVYIDNVKIDTIVADKEIKIISAMYDIEGHAFYYELPEKYFDKNKTITFKASLSNEPLINSPINLLSSSEDKYKELKKKKELKRVKPLEGYYTYIPTN